jgi:hypothetical protein
LIILAGELESEDFILNFNIQKCRIISQSKVKEIICFNVLLKKLKFLMLYGSGLCGEIIVNNNFENFYQYLFLVRVRVSEIIYHCCDSQKFDTKDKHIQVFDSSADAPDVK